MPDTMGSMSSEISDFLRGDLRDPGGQKIIRASINDAIESIWNSMMQVQIARFFGSSSPVSFTLAQGSQRVKVASITNPAVNTLSVGNVAGGTLGARSVTCAFTLVTSSGSETLISPTSNTFIPANNVTAVTAPPFVDGAYGWNLYACILNSAPGPLLQNQQPIPFFSAPGVAYVYNEPLGGFVSDPQFGQRPPIANTTADDLSWIDHMEIQTPDNVYRAWNQHSIDSEVMRRMAGTTQNNSPWAAYVWQLTSGGTLEFRPIAGTTFSPRYWYVAKPRRILYDQADLPYVNITGVHEFIREYALSICYMPISEFAHAAAYGKMADASRLRIVMALNQENYNQDKIITPYLW